MATMLPPQKGVEYITYINLTQQANTCLFKSNPTLASGDITITTDGNAVTNLDTLPDVDPDASFFVKVTVSATEMNGDNIAIVFHDAAGDEWCDLGINIQTSGQSFDAFKTLIDTLDTVADAIKAVTDLLPNAGVLSDLATILTAIQHATYGLSAIETKQAIIDGIVDSILNDTDTNGVVITQASADKVWNSANTPTQDNTRGADLTTYIKDNVASILTDTGTTLDDILDTLIARLTATRVGYLDNLSAGAVALASALTTHDTEVKAEINANETKIDAVPTVTEIDTKLAAEHGEGSWEGETAIEFEED